MGLRNKMRFLRGPGAGRYRPEQYWEGRAAELIEIYDQPDTWDMRGWMRGGVEEVIVPALLRSHGAQTVIVPGAGSGRQYGFIAAEGFSPRGFDISPSLVATCQERYPTVPTHVGTLVDAQVHERPADAVVTSAVLQHVPPDEIVLAVGALRSLATRLVIIREITVLTVPSLYQFAHDYDRLFAGWHQVHRETTDERPTVRVELIAWEPS
jgi:hypothetical protein